MLTWMETLDDNNNQLIVACCRPPIGQHENICTQRVQAECLININVIVFSQSVISCQFSANMAPGNCRSFLINISVFLALVFVIIPSVGCASAAGE